MTRPSAPVSAQLCRFSVPRSCDTSCDGRRASEPCRAAALRGEAWWEAHSERACHGTELALAGVTRWSEAVHDPRRSQLFRPSIDSALPGTSGRTTQRAKAHVRTLTPDDMDRVVELHLEGFGGAHRKEDLKGFLTAVFFGHPWVDDRFPSLAYVDKEGRMAGCIGVMPRPMMLDGEPIQAVVTHNFIVAPGQRDGLAAIQLVRTMMAAGPDLTLSDSNAAARKLSETLGAKTLAARSGRWFRVLRPAGLGVHLADRSLDGRMPRSAKRVLSGLAAGPDVIARMMPWSPVRGSPLEVPDDGLEAGPLAGLLDRLTAHLAVRPIYTADSLGWLLDTLRRTRQDQRLRVRLVREGRESVGWYVYYSRPGGIGRVLQLGAAPGAQETVLDHLFADASREGDVALSGQSDPGWTEALSAASCGTRPGSTWMLLHTANPRVAQALGTSDAFLSRLEGEAWLHFGY